jgi:hypothetical protein
MLINQNKWSRIFTFFLFIVGITLPFLLVNYVHYYYTNDVATFRGWAECLEKFSQQIYLKCLPTPPNYPVVGLFLSAGTIQAIKSVFNVTDSKTIDFIFRHYLAFFDLFNFILFTRLASLMQFRFPIFVGLILLMVPSTLVGGAIWGQIDGISLTFCLLATIGFFKSWLSNDADSLEQSKWKSVSWLLFGTLNLVIFILIKQLSLFSLPFFFILIGITGYKLWKNFHYSSLFWAAIALIIFILFFHYLDSLLAVPKHFNNSSLWFVLTGGGSRHAEIISGNGFNIWMFLGRNMISSSRAPFPLLSDRNALNVVPYYAGMILYGILMTFLLLTGFRISWQVLKWSGTKQRYNPEVFLLACLCFFFGLSQLGFNVLLTGTHERYLYLGYPFLLIAVTWFYVNKVAFKMRSLIFCFFAASAYGFFVFAWMNAPLPGILFPMRRHEFLASIHLFLLVILLEKWVQVWRYSEMTRKAKAQIKVSV